MALQFCDSFSHGMTAKWEYTYNYTFRAGLGRVFGDSIGFGDTNNGPRKTLPTPTDEIYFGIAFKHPSLITSGDLIRFRGVSGEQCQVNVNNGHVEAWRATVLLAQSASSTVYQAGVWHYLEVYLKIADAGGRFTIKVDGVTHVDYTGDTLNSGANVEKIELVGGGTNSIVYFDDMYICDATGTVNNTFLGDIVVEYMPVNGNGNSSVLVGSDADSTDNYLLVDEKPPSTTDYVGSATEGDKDTYLVGNITGTPATIVGVQVTSLVAKTDASAKFSRPIVRSGTTDYVGTSQALPTTTYAARTDVWETDPDTASAWTESGVNAMESGFEVRDS